MVEENNRMIENLIKPFVILLFFSGFILSCGYNLFGTPGLTIAFIITALWYVTVYYCRDYHLHRRFASKEIKKGDPWKVYQMVSQLAKEAKIRIPSVFISPKKIPTAFSLAKFGTKPSIVVSEGITQILTQDELKAVLAHEIFHIKQLDTLSYEIGSAVMTFFLFAGYLLDNATAFILTNITLSEKEVTVMTFTTIFIPLALMLLGWIIDSQSDYYADQFAAQSSGKPEHIARAIWKLSSHYKTEPLKVPFATAHFFIVNPSETGFFIRNFHSMPNVEVRIRSLINEYPPPSHK